MRYSIDNTPPEVISGWITPDDPRVICRVALAIEGRRLVEVAATEFVPGLRENGWHSTGLCRFRIDESRVPGLGELRDLEVYDVDSNMLVYRRCSTPGQTEGKLALINTSIQPETALQTALFPHFRNNYFGIGRFSEQEMVNLLSPTDLRSLFVSGHFLFHRYEQYIASGELMTALLVHDPIVEMATRMVWLRDRGRIGAQPGQGWRLGALAEAGDFAKGYDFADIRQAKHFLRMLPQAAYHMLYNPLTRQLGTSLPEDHMMPTHSVLSVEVLARVGVVGHRSHFEAFAATVYDRLGIDAPIPAPDPTPADVQVLADHLRSLKAARDFLIYDLAIAEGVQRSVARIWSA